MYLDWLERQKYELSLQALEEIAEQFSVPGFHDTGKIVSVPCSRKNLNRTEIEQCNTNRLTVRPNKTGHRWAQILNPNNNIYVVYM